MIGKKILAVDDDPIMLGFVRDILHANGYDAICATGGQEAIDILKQQTFDCAILDIKMPGKDGIDVAASMFKRRDKTPVIVFTSKEQAREEAILQGLANGREFLKKPCSEYRLLAAVGRETGQSKVVLTNE